MLHMYTCMLQPGPFYQNSTVLSYQAGEIAVAKQYITAEFTDFGYNIFEVCEKLTDKHSSEYISTELDAT